MNGLKRLSRSGYTWGIIVGIPLLLIGGRFAEVVIAIAGVAFVVGVILILVATFFGWNKK